MWLKVGQKKLGYVCSIVGGVLSVVMCSGVFWCVLVGGVSVCFVRGGGLCNGESDSWQPGPGLPGYGRHCSYTATCYITLAPC